VTDWQGALFTPRRVAVVGASASPGKAGALVPRNLTAVEAGFAGEVIAIHPSASEILGCPAYPSFGAVPAPVDLAIIVAPPAAVPEVIGVQCRPPIDLIRLARFIADLSQWFCAAAWLGELDLNPIIADGNGFTIVDARMRVVDSSTIV
jgi:predicted CoA-binding protein